MTKAIVIEDEKLASQYLIAKLNELAPDIEIEATLTDVKDSIRYLSAGTEAQIIFSDVQLGDGLSFSIFRKVPVNMPVESSEQIPAVRKTFCSRQPPGSGSRAATVER
jgi:DNA-binding LytR/AlgR family response regulator